MGKRILAIFMTIMVLFAAISGCASPDDAEPAIQHVENGLSAYELAVQLGYEGTVQEWLESLKGKSAYQIAVENGYSGTETEWLASLEAKTDNAVGIKDAKFNSKGELILTLSDKTIINLGVAVGANGTDGKDGAPGKDGADGAPGKDGVDGAPGKDGVDGAPGKDGANGSDGVSITTATINENGQLVLSFSNGNVVNLDKVVGANGNDGVSVTASKINENGELIITYSNGQEANLGIVIGAKGDKGDKGEDGKDGIDAIVSAVINENGELVITYSNGTIDNLGVIVGRDGIDGVDGAPGQDGINGENGKDGVSVIGAEITSDGELVLTYSNGQRSNLGKVIGADGKDGVDGAPGKDGVDGAPGKDGVDGAPGKDGVDGKTPYVGANGNWWIGETDTGVNAEGKDGVDGAPGKDGVDGAPGKDGVDGTPGKDGISVIKSEINNKGELVITYSNNQIDNLGVVVGSDGQNGAPGKDGVDGDPGKDGVGIANIVINNKDELVITLTNDTTMNLGCIKGADGEDGTDGAPGKDGIGVTGAVINAANELVITFSDNSTKNLGVVVGSDGQNGAPGKDGIGIKDTEINALGELVITYTDNTFKNLGVIVSDNGGAGTSAQAPRVRINTTTNEWEISTDGGQTYISTGVKATGANGVDGTPGKDGVSIIDAVINSNNELVLTFSDSSQKNLGIIVGSNGQDGAPGKDGADGAPGKDGADGAPGKDGADGAPGKDGVGISEIEINSNSHLIIKLSNNETIDLGVVVGSNGQDGAPGKDGVDGAPGKDGADGAPGKDGVGIKNVTVTDEGVLTIVLDNGAVLTPGNIKGKDGIGIAKTEINSDGKLVITYTDEKTVILDKVVGNDGVGIKSAELTDDYMLKLTFTDNGTQTVGPIRGEKGAPGKDGADGAPGKDGVDGAPGKDGVGIKEVSVGNDGYLYITYDNSEEAHKIAYIKGDKGDPGKDGADGQPGTDGAPGKDGVDGAPGQDGKTPYIGANGNWWIGNADTGINAEGTDGENGVDGAPGKDGVDGDKGDKGDKGDPGQNGNDGAPGKDGVSVVDSYVDEDLHLWIVLSDGTKIDAGYVGVNVDDDEGGSSTPVKYTVVFKDHDGTVLHTEEVESGKSATAPAAPSREGYTFAGWDKVFTNITTDIVITATYTQNQPQIKYYTVTFKDYNGDILKTDTVEEGKAATAPSAPSRDGYNFSGWDKSFSNITSDLTITAMYTLIPSKTYTVTFVDYDGTTLSTEIVNSGSDATPPAEPNKSGEDFFGWSGNYTNVTKDETVRAVYSDNKNIFMFENVEGAVGESVEMTLLLDGDVKMAGFDLLMSHTDNLIFDGIQVEDEDGEVYWVSDPTVLSKMAFPGDDGVYDTNDDVLLYVISDLDVTCNYEVGSKEVLCNYSGTKNMTKTYELFTIRFKIANVADNTGTIQFSEAEVMEVSGGAIVLSENALINGVVTVE